MRTDILFEAAGLDLDHVVINLVDLFFVLLPVPGANKPIRQVPGPARRRMWGEGGGGGGGEEGALTTRSRVSTSRVRSASIRA